LSLSVLLCLKQTAAAWRNVFYISGGVYLFGTIFYCMFGSGARQSWAKTEEDLAAENQAAQDTT